MQIDIVVFEGFDELDALAPFEVLQNAAAEAAEFQVRLVCWTGGPEVVAAHGLRLSVAEDDGSVAPDEHDEVAWLTLGEALSHPLPDPRYGALLREVLVPASGQPGRA